MPIMQQLPLLLLVNNLHSLIVMYLLLLHWLQTEQIVATTFAAASAPRAGAVVTVTNGTSTTFSPTGLVKWGSYVVRILQDATGGGVTFTLGTGGTCSAWKVSGGGSGAITLTATANAMDLLSFTYDGTNCLATLGANLN